MPLILVAPLLLDGGQVQRVRQVELGRRVGRGQRGRVVAVSPAMLQGIVEVIEVVLVLLGAQTQVAVSLVRHGEESEHQLSRLRDGRRLGDHRPVAPLAPPGGRLVHHVALGEPRLALKSWPLTHPPALGSPWCPGCQQWAARRGAVHRVPGRHHWQPPPARLCTLPPERLLLPRRLPPDTPVRVDHPSVA